MYFYYRKELLKITSLFPEHCMVPSDKVCLVTGASSGIGFAIAKSLLADGYRVVATARREAELGRLGGADVLAGDLTDPMFLDNLERHVVAHHKKCDYLFNCAGSIETGTIEELDIGRMAAMLRLNIEATFRLTYKILKLFRQQTFGHVINISSVLGTKVRPTAGAYAASKFAMEALAEALRMELAGSDIAISCIEPGLVMTHLHDHWKVHPRISMNIHEPLSVDDIVETVRFIMKQPAHVRIPKVMVLPKDHLI